MILLSLLAYVALFAAVVAGFRAAARHNEIPPSASGNAEPAARESGRALSGEGAGQ